MCGVSARLSALLLLVAMTGGAQANYVGDGGAYSAMIYVIAIILGLIVAVIIIFLMFFLCFRPYLNREKEKSMRGSTARISYHSSQGGGGPQRGFVNLRPDPGATTFGGIGGNYGNKRNSDPVILGVDHNNMQNYNNEPYRSSLPAINQAPPSYDTPSNLIGAQMGVSQVTRQISAAGSGGGYQQQPAQTAMAGYQPEQYQQEPYGGSNRNSQHNYSRDGTATPSGSMGDAHAQQQVVVQDQYLNQAGRAAQATTTYRTTTTTTRQAVLGAYTGSSV